MPSGSSANTNTSSAHIFELLGVIGRSQAPIGAAEVSRLLSLPTTTAYRALLTLEAAGYIRRFESSAKFVLGPVPASLVRAFHQQFPLRAAALPYLRHISVASGLTTTLVMPVGWYAVRIAKVGGNRDIMFRTHSRDVHLLGHTLAGTMILESFSPDAREGYERFAATHGGEAKPENDTMALGIDVPDGGTIAAIEILNAATMSKEQRDRVGESAAEAVRVLAAIARKGDATQRNPYLHLDPDSIEIWLQ